MFELLLLFSQVVEKGRVFVTDANDEKPEFLNLPFIVSVPEVSYRILMASCCAAATSLSLLSGCY